MENNFKENRTMELVFIIDRSGSMAGLESDTIGGFNSMISRQKKEKGDCRVTTVFFNNRVDVIHNRIDLMKMRPLPDSVFQPGGCTAMLDAVGSSIQNMISLQRYTDPASRADKVLFVIITDGMENASREYTWNRVRQMIREERDRYGWEFIFLGANIDAEEVADDMGIDRRLAATYINDAAGVEENFRAMANSVAMFCEDDNNFAMPMENIRQDYRKRSVFRNRNRK